MITGKSNLLPSRRKILRDVAVGASLAVFQPINDAAASDPAKLSTAQTAQSVHWGPDPLFEKPLPITVAEFDAIEKPGITLAEVNDYAPAHYKGTLSPSPPHADHNPGKSIMVRWSGRTHRLIFTHEASYDPILELPNGASLCNQFFEGNLGWGELFNNNGRKERNSFVDIVQSGSDRAWVRWNYFCVNKDDDANPILRGTEDYVTYPNGFVWRRLTYQSLMPGDPKGYSWQPIDFFGAAPAGTTWSDLFECDHQYGDYLVGTVIDAYSPRCYDLFWDDNGNVRRNGDAQLLLDISHSRGFALIMPFKAGYLFTVMGAASGFPSEKSQVVDNSFKDTGGWGWGAARWDHWPIGWLNSQTHHYQPGGQYPYSFGTFSHYILNKPIRDAHNEMELAARDMELNRWSERHVYYTLTGMAENVDQVRGLAKSWLDQGTNCARPESVEHL
jgi:hypothetical protein